MPQLDAMRFFAIVAVMAYHNWRPGPAPWIFAEINWGELGVRLFFVLSGFLITGILLRGRESGARNSRLLFIRQFYVRRFLRIFPVYYALLLVVVAGNIGGARHLWPWFATYTTNVYIHVHMHWIGVLSPLWSLAVQEQFYLVWPLLLLFLPRRWLVPALLAVVCAAPLFRLYESYHYRADVAGPFASQTIALAVVDSLAAGALLAVLTKHGLVKEKLIRMAVPVGVACFFVLLGLTHYGIDRHAHVALGQTAEALVFAAVIYAACNEIGGVLGRVLSWSPIVYLGRISYGIYLFHMLVPTMFRTAARNTSFVPYAEKGFLFFIATSVVTIGVAAASWHFFERPLNDLKRFFPYGRTRVPAAVPAPHSAPSPALAIAAAE